MAAPKFVLLPPEELKLSGEFSEFNAKSKIDPPLKSSYLAIGAALFQSLIRIKDSTMSAPSWAALDASIKTTDEFVKQIPDYLPYWDKLKFMINEIFKKREKVVALRNLRQMLEINHQYACDTIDIGMRLLFCVLVDKDHEYNDILREPYPLRGKEFYLQHFCNKLRVNVLIMMATSHQYFTRDDKNNAPLVTLFIEDNGAFSVLYHRESLHVDLGNPMTESLEKFPFFYNPKAAVKPNVSQASQPSQAAQQRPEFQARDQPASPVIPPPENRVSEPSSPARDNVYKQFIFYASTVIFTNLPNLYDEILLKIMNDAAASDPSLEDKDFLRLKNNLIRLQPVEQPQASQPKQQCGHPLLFIKPMCGQDHCAFCLKEEFDEKTKKGVVFCEHGSKISPKIAKDLENLLKSWQQSQGSSGAPMRGNSQPSPQMKQPPSMQSNYPSGNQASQISQAPSQINNPNLGPKLSNPPAFNTANDSHVDGEVSIPVVTRKPNSNMQPGQYGPSNVSQNFPQPSSGMRVPSNQSQFGANPGPQNKYPGPSSSQSQFQQPQSQMPPVSGMPKPPSLSGIGSMINPPPPKQTGAQCYQCDETKPSDDFSINCPDHKTCNICRVYDLKCCINCNRIYSVNEIEVLSGIANSLK